MNLDRDDLAARFAVAIAGGLSADSSVQTYDHGVVIEDAFDLADALIARLRPATVAPVADAAPAPSAATDPRRTVGAVTHPKHDSGLWIVINGDETDCCRRLDGNESGRLGDFFRDDEFVRWATREECERHGIPYVERGAAPSPAAGLDAPAFDEASERETAVDIAKDRGLDVAEEVGFVAGWLARARIAAKGGAS